MLDLSVSPLTVSSPVSLCLTFYLCHGYSWGNRVNLQSFHQQRLTEVLGAPKGLRDEHKRLGALVTVNKALICSCQVTAQRHKCWIPNLWFCLTLFHVILYCSPFFRWTSQITVPLVKNIYSMLITSGLKLISFNGLLKQKQYCGEIPLQWRVSYSLFCTCSLHYMMLISFCFFFCIQ